MIYRLFVALLCLLPLSASASWHSVLQVSVGSASTTTTFDPVNLGTGNVLTNGNLTATYSSGGSSYVIARSLTSHSSGKYYAEFTMTNSVVSAANLNVGITIASNVLVTSYLGGAVNANSSAGVFGSTTGVFINNVSTGTVSTFTQGDVVGMALDAGGQLIWFRTNGGNWNGSGTNNPATGVGGISVSAITGPYFAAAAPAATTGVSITANFGATAYSNAAPSGFGNW